MYFMVSLYLPFVTKVIYLGPLVQSVVTLTSSLMANMLTVLVKYNI